FVSLDQRLDLGRGRGWWLFAFVIIAINVGRRRFLAVTTPRIKHSFILQPTLRRRPARREECHVLATKFLFKMFAHRFAKTAYRQRIPNHEHLWRRRRRARLLRPLEFIS